MSPTPTTTEDSSLRVTCARFAKEVRIACDTTYFSFLRVKVIAPENGVHKLAPVSQQFLSHISAPVCPYRQLNDTHVALESS